MQNMKMPLAPITRAAFGAFLLASLLAAPPSRADEVKAGDLVISQAWSRATPGGAKVGGGFLTIENKGTAPDRLIGGAAEAAVKVEVHEMSMDKGVAKMRPVKGGLEIKPGETVELKPGSFHVMFLGLKKPLASGDHIKATLVFEKAGKIEVEYDVRAMGATSTGHDSMPGMHIH